MSIFSKTSTYDPMSAYTPEQQTAIKALMSLASTGSGAGITLGQGYGGDLGYYTQTAGELQSLANLENLYGGSELSTAKDVYTKMANTEFNPDDPSSGYAAFSRQLAKAGKESEDAINREAAITGSRYGTSIAKSKADLASDLADQRGSYLADLYNTSQNRALQGASGLQSLVGTQQSLLSQIANQSAVARELKNQEAQDQYSEWQRARSEKLQQIGLMQEQWQNPMGVIESKSPTAFGKLASTALQIGGAAVGSMFGPLGTAIGGSLGGALGGSLTGSSGGSGSTGSILGTGGSSINSLLAQLAGGSTTQGLTGWFNGYGKGTPINAVNMGSYTALPSFG